MGAYYFIILFLALLGEAYTIRKASYRAKRKLTRGEQPGSENEFPSALPVTGQVSGGVSCLLQHFRGRSSDEGTDDLGP